MTNIAAEFQAGLKDLPPAERAKDMLRISALTEAASNLASGATPPALLNHQPYNPRHQPPAQPARTPPGQAATRLFSNADERG